MLRLNQRIERSGKNNLALRRMCLQASTDVDGVAQRGEVQYAPRSHIADEGDTSVGSDTEGEFGDLRGQFESGTRCLASIFGASDTLDEEAHHFVANQLVHDAFIVDQAIKLIETCIPFDVMSSDRGASENEVVQAITDPDEFDSLIRACMISYLRQADSPPSLKKFLAFAKRVEPFSEQWKYAESVIKEKALKDWSLKNE